MCCWCDSICGLKGKIQSRQPKKHLAESMLKAWIRDFDLNDKGLWWDMLRKNIFQTQANSLFLLN